MARVPDFGEAETRQAIEAANRALPAWSKMLAKERSKRIRAWFDLMMENADELALLLTNEQGKPLAEAKGEIVYAAGFVEFFAEEAKRVYGETIPTFKADARIVVIRQPVGVVAAITPFNFPLNLVAHKVGPALAAGNTVVAKPSEITPMTAFHFARIAAAAGLPPGVLNIIHGAGPKIGPPLTGHPDVRAVSFTGGTSTGTSIASVVAPKLKKLSLELGGKNPNIVFADADMDEAVKTSLRSSFQNQGQICLCGSRIFYVALNAPYLKRTLSGVPYVTLKAAQSVDGRIATSAGDARWISGGSRATSCCCIPPRPAHLCTFPFRLL
jgi:succinate-semialdehyde dehydrogenase/glutarate-semialdehyde dehydrogenase